MHSKRGNILIIFLAIIALVGTALFGYLFWKNKQVQNKPVKNPAPEITNPDPMANWYSIRITQHNFSFKAPPGWGTISNIMTGNFEAFTPTTVITRNQSLIIITPNQNSTTNVLIDFNNPTNRITKNGNDNILDQIISAFKFL